MKTENAIRARLKKLRRRYLNKYVTASQERRHENCAYNVEMMPLDRHPHVMTEFELAPRVSSSVVIIHPDLPVRLCIHGANDPTSWNGDLCDDDDVAKKCNRFKPRVSADEAKNEFNELLKDDDYVLKNHGDIAALQWVLNDRVHAMPLSLLEKITIAVTQILVKIRIARRLERSNPPALPEGLWNDTNEAVRK